MGGVYRRAPVLSGLVVYGGSGAWRCSPCSPCARVTQFATMNFCIEAEHAAMLPVRVLLPRQTLFGTPVIFGHRRSSTANAWAFSSARRRTSRAGCVRTHPSHPTEIPLGTPARSDFSALLLESLERRAEQKSGALLVGRTDDFGRCIFFLGGCRFFRHEQDDFDSVPGLLIIRIV